MDGTTLPQYGIYKKQNTGREKRIKAFHLHRISYKKHFQQL
jgi:hypothetical protein